MKYVSVNRLRDFEFHDADIALVSMERDTLRLSVKHLNIHKGTEQNGEDWDMEIELAQIRFEDVRELCYEPGRRWITDESGNHCPTGEQLTFRGDDARKRIIRELNKGVAVFFLDEEDGICRIGGCGEEPYLEIAFGFGRVTIEWDAYSKKAWYELRRRYDREVVLAAPEGDQRVSLTIVVCEEDTSSPRDGVVKGASVTASLQYNARTWCGSGRDDYLWIDAFGNLQGHLPTGSYLKCCLACRHGNLCPAGNNPEEVFCTKDVQIGKKQDLFSYTEDAAEREKRSRGYFDLCGDFCPQTEDFFTYNDFLTYCN